MSEGAPSRRRTAARRLIRVLWVLVALLAGLLALRMWVIAPYRIPTSSMEPTLIGDDPREGVPGDTVLVLRTAYLVSGPRRWDIVAFHAVETGPGGRAAADLVKRVVGLPGETVEIADGRILIDGEAIEPPPGLTGREPPRKGRFDRVTLDAGEYFVLGDNSFVSEDSRLWGPLPERNIFGKVIAVVYPLERARWVE